MKHFLGLLLLIELLLLAAFAVTPSFAGAVEILCPDGKPPPEGEVCLPNPLRVKTPGELVVAAFVGFALILGAVGIAFTVFSGFKLIIASSEESIKSARDSLTWSIGGFAVSLLTYTFIAATAKFLGFDPSLIPLGRDEIGSVLRGPSDPTDFISVMNFVMLNFLGIIGFATTLMIIYYGFRYLTSAGNEESVEKAKIGLKWSMLGLAITLLAFTIITSVRKYLLF